MNSFTSLVLLLVYSFVRESVCHSWVDCVDYRGEITGDPDDFNFDNCKGYTRDYATVASGWNVASSKVNKITSTSGVDFCKSNYQGFDGLASDYSDAYPYAHYVVGNTYRIVWPAKNHANYECMSYNDDKQMKLYVDPTPDDLEYPDDINDYNLVIDWHAGYEDIFEAQDDLGIDGVPFQNCPDYCSDTDAAVCYGDFTLTQEIFDSSFNGREGIYTFIWFWEFTGSTTIYANCWEANVTSDGTANTVIGGDTTANDGGGDDASQESSEEEEVEQEYVLTIPICYDGAAYDETLLQTAFDNLANALGNEVSFTINGYLENGLQTEWNATIDSSMIGKELEITLGFMAANGTVCNYVQEQFGNAGTCATCGGSKITSFTVESGNSGSGGDDGEGVKLALGLITVAVVILGLLGFWYYRTKINPQPAGAGKTAESGMAMQINSGGTASTGQAVLPAEGTDGAPTGRQSGTRPARPPPPPRT